MIWVWVGIGAAMATATAVLLAISHNQRPGVVMPNKGEGPAALLPAPPFVDDDKGKWSAWPELVGRWESQPVKGQIIYLEFHPDRRVTTNAFALAYPHQERAYASRSGAVETLIKGPLLDKDAKPVGDKGSYTIVVEWDWVGNTMLGNVAWQFEWYASRRGVFTSATVPIPGAPHPETRLTYTKVR